MCDSFHVVLKPFDASFKGFLEVCYDVLKLFDVGSGVHDLML